jgi:histidyl-tRNA synthetase
MPEPASFQAPTGTRDMYPADAARRRFITEAWRRVSVNHGFEEVDGPTFEHLDLYTVKSGEGIISELFSFTRAGGEKTYALRPEFTPTLARLYAAKAASLPKPTRWFTAGPFFRAERPQRGRLREFLQWNVDLIGDDSPAADAEVIACCVELLSDLGLKQSDIRVRINDRRCVARLLAQIVPMESVPAMFSVLDKRAKVRKEEFIGLGVALGASPQAMVALDSILDRSFPLAGEAFVQSGFFEHAALSRDAFDVLVQDLKLLYDALAARDLVSWCDFDFSIVRGLAYYTGIVFEVVVGGERAVAGGGRYDKLIELFGGPATPAVGFGMGDVVLALVLQDRGLMPKDDELMRLSGQRPDVFVIAASPEADAAARRLVATLRRSQPAPEGSTQRRIPALHARQTSKTTRNVGKLLKEAADLAARLAVIVENDAEATIKDMRTGQQDETRTPLADLPTVLRARLASA